ncbi:MAG TPA: glycosyltransferase [Moheibacter sp.]|nr:glycosyltransferase [Moheibacter sp.]
MKKKILIRIGSLRHGGAEKVLVTFLKNLPKDKYEIDLLLNLYSGKYLSEVPDWIHVLYLNKGEMITTNRIQDIPQKAFRVIYQKVLKLFPKLLYQIILKNKQYDIEFAAIQGMAKEILNSPLKHSKKIVWIHSDLRKATYQTYSDDDLRRFFGFDKIMVNADEVLMDFESLSSNEGESDRLVRIYNPLDTQEVLRLSNETVEECHFSKETPTFIAIGTVYPAKGYDRLLKVHKRLIDEGFHHRLLILGDGYDFKKIRKLKESLVLNDTVKLLGYVKNPYPYLKAADYFVLSSRYESFPTVLFEATILRKKIISTIVPGAEELLKNGSLGLLVENSTDGIYQGMKKALENPLSFDQYVEAFSCYDSPFILENSVQKIQQILDEL